MDSKDSNAMFEKLRTLVNLGIAPYFDLITSATNTSNIDLEDGSKGSAINSVNMAKKKLNELSLSLQHLQQRIQIPDLLVSVHPKIEDIVKNSEGQDGEELNESAVNNLVTDSTFLNELTRIVNSWIKQIQSITRLDHDPLDGNSLAEEVQFWKSMELALFSITQQMSSPLVKVSIDFLNKAKRFHVTLGFQNDTGVNEKMITTKLYNSLLKELPIDELMSVSSNIEDLDKFEISIINLFNHFKSKLKNLNSFPLPRAIEIIEVGLNDITDKFKSILSTHSLMSLGLSKFLEIYENQVLKIFELVDQNIKFMINLIRELLRKRLEKFIIIKINQIAYNELKDRLKALKDFRLNHQDLITIVEKFLKNDGFTESNKLVEAYNKYILPVNVLDMSKQGQRIWTMNEKSYMSIYNQLNSVIMLKLNALFDSCNSFNDFLTIFSIFDGNSSTAASDREGMYLLINDEYKLKILSTANKETESLIKLNLTSRKTLVEYMESTQRLYKFHSTQVEGSDNKDFSSVVTEIKWNLSMIKKLNFYLVNLLKLLGTNWNKYSLGSKIESEISTLTQSLNPDKLFQSWLDYITSKVALLEKSGSIVKIIQPNESEMRDLIVNYDTSLIEITQQLIQITSLGFKVPVSVIIKYRKVEKLTPFIVSLIENVTILRNLLNNDLANTSYGQKFGFLLEKQKQLIMNSLKDLISVDWVYLSQALDLKSIGDSAEKKHTSNEELVEIQSLNILNGFQSAVYKLYEKLNKLSKFENFLSIIYHQLKTCEYNFETIKELLITIQEEFNKLLLEDFEAIDRLGELINQEIKLILAKKCADKLQFWERTLTTSNSLDDADDQTPYVTQAKGQFEPPQSHSIVFQDKIFKLSPELSSTKQHNIQKLNSYLSIVELQLVIKSDLSSSDESFFDLVYSDTTLTSFISKILIKIDCTLNEGNDYFNKWKLIQNLWELDLHSEQELAKVVPKDSSLTQWLQSIREILGLRYIFDRSDTITIFGTVLTIDFSSVQNRVNLKFDYFQEELLKLFSTKINVETSKLSNELIKAQKSLELKLDFQVAGMILVANLDEYLQHSNQMANWTNQIEVLEGAQTLLLNQRFKFPNNWMYVEQLENLVSIVTTLLRRKLSLIEDNFEVLASKIKVEASRTSQAIDTLIKEWPVKKPVSGSLNPSVAITHLEIFEKRCRLLDKEKSSIINVSKLLDISIDLHDNLEVVLEEIYDLKSVWSSINTLWDYLEKLRSLKWADIQPRGLRHDLDDLLAKSRSLPLKVRQYGAFDEIQNVIKLYLKNHSFVSELKSESMKPRHWKILLVQLGAETISYDSMTMGEVWNLNFGLNDSALKAILIQANNEQTIEDNLELIKKEWSTITFEMFNYENKARLVKNWNKLFDQCNNDLNTLSSMSSSPYYHSFDQEISSLDGKLNKLYVLLDTWIDVQRQWVYLDGVFGNKNNDIKNLLPIESARFTNITYEFLNTLKRIYKFNLVIESLLVGDIQVIMDKLSESLTKVRKSLTDYLEKQRELCPRFYFVGNEDLLEIIGGSMDVERINRHFKKMFSGVSKVDYQKESSSIVAIRSEEDEIVTLSKPVSLIKYPKLNEWIKELELEIKLTISQLVKSSIAKFELELTKESPSLGQELKDLIFSLPAQVSTLVAQITFTKLAQESIDKKSFSALEEKYGRLMKYLIELLANDTTPLERKKCQYFTIEIVHHKDIIASLSNAKSDQDVHLIWGTQQLFYYDTSSSDPLQSLTIRQANASFYYGFEYLGIPEKLAYTPLIRKCFLTMTQALHQKLGGSPFGPAGTGKTESIKALGNNLGKMVLVFNCDDSFDFQAMGRIFLGLCKVGSWGCFDEFNRLDENILSAVSSQIEAIELSLSSSSQQVEISGKTINVHPETGIFVTMNPGYVGRYELPENLKKLFRGFSMEKPDREIIVEVLLTSQTFEFAKEIAKIIVPLFLELESCCSKQSHYDFGLRALKNTLIRCGLIKRNKKEDLSSREVELRLILRSIQETVAPKLIKSDEILLEDLLAKYFPSVSYETDDNTNLVLELQKHMETNGFYHDDKWMTKALQLYQIQTTNHGIMLVGESGSGKSVIWNLVLKSLGELDGMDHASYVIDCKVLSKNEIYGSLDSITRDWTDGLFTSILRKIRANLRGELNKRIWIVFDGDIDPEWAENLNSVLDDNRILTLPNGERLALPDNVRLIFEVDSIKFTTPATISRCGMIWFDSSLIPIEGLIKDFTHDISNNAIEIRDDLTSDLNEILAIQRTLVNEIGHFIKTDTLTQVIEEAKNLEHIMEFTVQRAIQGFAALIKSYFRRLIIYKLENRDIPLDNYSKFVGKAVLLSLAWAFAGDTDLNQREKFALAIIRIETLSNIDQAEGNILDFDISFPDFEWEHWNLKVESIELEPQHVSNPNTVVPTLDTVRHDSLIYSILNEHKPLLLCGPPGSGKTMTLLESLRRSPSLDVLSLNFSKDTTPESLMKSLEQHCTYKKTNNGIVLTPLVNGKWVVVFCDEINLPAVDKYGTQTVISLLRQMIEQKGFWRPKDRQWVSLSNIQFVGACNSPNDPGRNKLSQRFLRHVSLIMVDYPGKNSLSQIYETFNLAVMKCAPDLRGYTRVTTEAMIEIYLRTKEHLGSKKQDHYIYSPRELTRWARSILEGVKASEYSDLLSFVRLWNHEGLRLFYDRLVGTEEKEWTKELFKEVTIKYFQNIDIETVLQEPILYSTWLSSNYESVDQRELRAFIAERLRVFSEEEIEVDLVLHGDLLDHSLRIDRVLRQPQGHMILVGPSTSGKTTLSKFVAWMNGLKVVQLNVYKNYGIENFDSKLKEILLRCAKGERVCFIIDESSILDTSFIERMNTLLANAEIPGLFEGDEFTSLMSLCLEQSNSQGLLLDSDEELYSWFTKQISENLHVIFNITESGTSNSNRPAVISSPALFNRCVLSWMGDWSNDSLVDVASSLIETVPLDMSSYEIPASFNQFISNNVTGFRDVVVDAFVFIHRFVLGYATTLSYQKTPSNFVSLIQNFINTFNSKQFELEENQRHISNGLDKLRETVLQVSELKILLSKKQESLRVKDQEAKVMLNKMLTNQNEAERKQEFSVATQEELEKQEVEIQRRRAKVMKDLEKAEPAVIEAQRGVQNIKKQHLTEIRSMANPPAAVKMAMESVCILIGYEVSSWRDVQLIVRKDDFIANIVNFNTEEQLSAELREYMEQVYLSRDDYNYETVYRASKACGPLLQWVETQLTYSRILQDIGPMREEVQILEEQTKKTKAQLIAIDQMIQELELSINNYKDEYSSLIRETENIKSEMQGVEERVKRSLTLIDNLTLERERWKVSIKRFGLQRERLIGNSILSSAFLVYSGIYDQRGRENLMKEWKRKLMDSGILYDETVTIADNLNESGEILKWEKSGLAFDDLNVENFTIMKLSKTPIIIDPTNSVTNVIVKSYAPRKVIVTSFLNEGFVKQLENSIRFGGVIIIQDAEFYDPVLNNILRLEIHRNGGRMMINLGEQEIDYSPDFKLFLHSTDSELQLSPFVSSRTSIINFTITSGSLQNKVLNMTLQDTRPEIEQKRVQMASLQSEYQVRLYKLEQELLNSLGDSSGSILENDSVVNTLENLKSESNEIDQKMKESLTIMETVDTIRNTYEDVAKHSTRIFNVFKEMDKLGKLYKFSLTTFIRTYSKVLRGGNTADITEMINELYKEAFSVISCSLVHHDKIIFALCLSLSYYGLEIGQQVIETIRRILNFLVVKGLVDITDILQATYAKFEQTTDIDSIVLENSDNDTIKLLGQLIKSTQSSQKDAFMDAFSNISSFLFTGVGDYSSRYSLKEWTSDQEVAGQVMPIILASPDGYDGTFKVEKLAQDSKQKLVVVSMGSKEGIEIANKELSIASNKGHWILIQNIQLAVDWLNYLERRLDTYSGNSNFKIFLTCNLTSNIPSALVSKSKVLVFENQPGLRNAMLETFASLPNEMLTASSSILKHVIFLLVWFHSVIQERLRFTPISFKKKYDINDSDFSAGLKVIQDELGSLDSNVTAEAVPWKHLSYLIGEITYGGKIDDKEDLRYISGLAAHLFRFESFDSGFNLTQVEENVLVLPEGFSIDAYKNWIAELPGKTPLGWIGLDEEVDVLVREKQGQQVAKSVLCILEEISE
ncbi:uncharacterized protein CANTADRAFT_86169 [Suhomyces tanzawaensis NRRL Y-17324]|uniref:Dynein heavy chain, cytoplasmic n=1 Tax=Suhomyces tanzawaensis NRRL Y-17324 TaxID=984487 RepID=A0A1E4SC23_9ASCO|nr:uncharacterized protein CANTADRAFT_86169 [Suhomyces tanzawaensis NRRL Y-17324]ODV77051.1 hypothetical protein CANTADRAFT_86169 [Suhomyces tanzawaensis NRRL Y-17324]